MSSITTCDFKECKEEPGHRGFLRSGKRDITLDFCDSHIEEIFDLLEKNNLIDIQD